MGADLRCATAHRSSGGFTHVFSRRHRDVQGEAPLLDAGQQRVATARALARMYGAIATAA